MLWAALPGLAGRPEGDAAPVPQRDVFLARMARVASLYRDYALRFTCNETISFSGKGKPEVHRFEYVYLYSKEEQALVDYRVPRGRLSRASEARQERVAMENYGLPVYLLRAYSWVFIFQESAQPLYRYSLEGIEKFLGREAVRVRFEPVPPYREEVNNWFGTALVDLGTYQLLHVEAIEAGEYDQYLSLRREVEERREPGDPNYRGTYTYSTYSTDFDVVRNGLRFPGRVMIERSEFEVRGGAGKGSFRKLPLYKVIQTYKRYQFFSVRTEAEIRRIILAED
jgi:hypothetical protein